MANSSLQSTLCLLLVSSILIQFAVASSQFNLALCNRRDVKIVYQIKDDTSNAVVKPLRYINPGTCMPNNMGYCNEQLGVKFQIFTGCDDGEFGFKLETHVNDCEDQRWMINWSDADMAYYAVKCTETPDIPHMSDWAHCKPDNWEIGALCVGQDEPATPANFRSVRNRRAARIKRQLRMRHTKN